MYVLTILDNASWFWVISKFLQKFKDSKIASCTLLKWNMNLRLESNWRDLCCCGLKRKCWDENNSSRSNFTNEVCHFLLLNLATIRARMERQRGELCAKFIFANICQDLWTLMQTDIWTGPPKKKGTLED